MEKVQLRKINLFILKPSLISFRIKFNSYVYLAFIGMATVSIKDISKQYGDIQAIEGITFDVQNKEFLTILGPSGCGKTTLLRLIAGLETPTLGDILIDNVSVIDVPVSERDIALIFQTYALYNHMTVYDNIAFPLKMRGLSKKDIDSKVKETAEMLGIRELLDRKPSKLSGGEQQRVAIGRAIIREPKVFLMDEPLTFLDPKLRTQMRIEIKTLQRRVGITTIYVTHDQAEAMTMSDKIAVINKGVLQQLGTPIEIYNKPVNTFVASFLGSPSMNLLNCSCVENNGKIFLDLVSFQLDVTDLKSVLDKRKNNDIVLGIRPEDITVSKKKSSATVESEVFIVEPLGYEVVLVLKTGGNILNVKADAEIDIRPGEKVWLTFNKNKIHIFNRSGETLT